MQKQIKIELKDDETIGARKKNCINFQSISKL